MVSERLVCFLVLGAKAHTLGPTSKTKHPIDRREDEGPNITLCLHYLKDNLGFK